jgi:membrane-bound ClpP family serine protease
MKRWPVHVVIRYSLLQIPEFSLLIAILSGLHYWFAIPLWVVAIIAGIWLLKDIILFFYVWPAYEMPRNKKDRRVTGVAGIAIEALDPGGYVEINGELWKAQTEDNRQIRAGEKVEVLDQKGLLLIVRRRKT